MHKYIIMGPQGCGKGTQARLLCQDYDLVHISIGDIFRWNMKNHTKLAARVQRIMNQGRLVPDEIVHEVVRKRLDEHDWNYGFVLDGFPRTRAQAEFLFENYNLDKAIYLDVPSEVVYQRVMHRARVGEGSDSSKRAERKEYGAVTGAVRAKTAAGPRGRHPVHRGGLPIGSPSASPARAGRLRGRVISLVPAQRPRSRFTSTVSR